MTPSAAVYEAEDHGSTDTLRSIASQQPRYAYLYATLVEGPHDETRIGASKNPDVAYDYARFIDKASHPVTRQGACYNPYIAFCYARDIEGPHDDTRRASSKDPDFALSYALVVDKTDHPVTREATCRDNWTKAEYTRIFG